jgi:two-component system chemotaxis sensor kinase CheA
MSTFDPQIFDSLLEPTFLVTEEGVVVYCNEPGALLADMTAKKIIRSKIKYDALFQFAEPLQAFVQLSQAEGASMYQEVGFSANGKSGRAQITLQKIHGETARWLIYMRDVTLEETLQKKYRRELEQKEDVITDLETASARLEDYSKNLESMAAIRTQQISEMNQKMQALLDSLTQGFFIVGRDGICMGISSKACEQVIEKNPNGLTFSEVLGLEAHELPGMDRWLLTCFEEMLPFEDLVELGPKKYKHNGGREVELSYFPLRGEGNEMLGIVVVATDISDLLSARQQAESDRANAKMILNLVKNRKQIRTFINETSLLLAEIDAQRKLGHPDYDSIFRCLHTIKGSAGIFSIQALIKPVHEAESLLTEFARTGDEKLFNVVSQLCERLPEIFKKFRDETLKLVGFEQEAHADTMEVSRRTVDQFAQLVRKKAPELVSPYEEIFYFEPAEWSFTNHSENLSLLAEKLGKQLSGVEIHGGDLKIFRSAYTRVFESLIHAFRNALDHGIETPEERISAGKKPSGTIHLKFERTFDGKFLLLTIEDDGRGIDVARVREKLASKGFNVSCQSDEQVIQHIFDPQFSTRDTITELSGRGVGMDAIAFAVKAMGGAYKVQTLVGIGSKIELVLPWAEPGGSATKAA